MWHGFDHLIFGYAGNSRFTGAAIIKTGYLITQYFVMSSSWQYWTLLHCSGPPTLPDSWATVLGQHLCTSLDLWLLSGPGWPDVCWITSTTLKGWFSDIPVLPFDLLVCLIKHSLAVNILSRCYVCDVTLWQIFLTRNILGVVNNGRPVFHQTERCKVNKVSSDKGWAEIRLQSDY